MFYINKILVTLCSSLAILITQDSYCNSYEKNQQLCTKYKDEIQTLYKIVKRDEYNAIKLYDDSEMYLNEINIFYSKIPENDKYYKLKVIFNKIKFETWKHVHYNVKVTSRVEFYENVML